MILTLALLFLAVMLVSLMNDKLFLFLLIALLSFIVWG
jgi:hypothetical protein